MARARVSGGVEVRSESCDWTSAQIVLVQLPFSLKICIRTFEPATWGGVSSVDKRTRGGREYIVIAVYCCAAAEHIENPGTPIALSRALKVMGRIRSDKLQTSIVKGIKLHEKMERYVVKHDSEVHLEGKLYEERCC